MANCNNCENKKTIENYIHMLLSSGMTKKSTYGIMKSKLDLENYTIKGYIKWLEWVKADDNAGKRFGNIFEAKIGSKTIFRTTAPYKNARNFIHPYTQDIEGAENFEDLQNKCQEWLNNFVLQFLED